MRSLALLAHDDPHGDAAPHVVRLAKALGAVSDEVLVVSAGEVSDDGRAALGTAARAVDRVGVASVFGRWAAGLRAALPGGAEDVGRLDRLLLVDDTVVGPLRPLRQALPDGHRGLRGVTVQASSPHALDHRVLDLGVDVLRSPLLPAFLDALPRGDGGPGDPRLAADLTRWARASGVQVTTAVRLSPAARARTATWRLRQGARLLLTSSGGAAAVHSDDAGPFARAWNLPLDLAFDAWAAGADGSMPFVALSAFETGARPGPQALRRLTSRHPEAFHGVPEYLARRRAVAAVPRRKDRSR